MTDIAENFVDDIGMKVDAAYLNAVGAAVNSNTGARPASGAFSSCPSAGIAGRLFFAIDAGLVLRDNGTTWDVVGGNYQPYGSIPSSGWSTTSLGSATITSDKGTRLLTLPAANANPIVEYRTLSSTANWTATVHLDPECWVGGGTSWSGMYVRKSDSGNVIFFGTAATTGEAWVRVDNGTPTNTASGNYALRIIDNTLRGFPAWLRIRDDGVTRFYDLSWNGIDWSTQFSHVRTTHITPDQVGWGGANNGNNQTNRIRLRSFVVI